MSTANNQPVSSTYIDTDSSSTNAGVLNGLNETFSNKSLSTAKITALEHNDDINSNINSMANNKVNTQQKCLSAKKCDFLF